MLFSGGTERSSCARARKQRGVCLLMCCSLLYWLTSLRLGDLPSRLLRELYNKFHDQGFEIYQVSLDPDEHFWKQQTAALPWISVRETNANSTTLTIYNVQAVPEFFLIDRGNNIVGRSQTIKDVEQAIRNLL